MSLGVVDHSKLKNQNYHHIQSESVSSSSLFNETHTNMNIKDRKIQDSNSVNHEQKGAMQESGKVKGDSQSSRHSDEYHDDENVGKHVQTVLSQDALSNSVNLVIHSNVTNVTLETPDPQSHPVSVGQAETKLNDNESTTVIPRISAIPSHFTRNQVPKAPQVGQLSAGVKSGQHSRSTTIPTDPELGVDAITKHLGQMHRSSVSVSSIPPDQDFTRHIVSRSASDDRKVRQRNESSFLGQPRPISRLPNQTPSINQQNVFSTQMSDNTEIIVLPNQPSGPQSVSSPNYSVQQTVPQQQSSINPMASSQTISSELPLSTSIPSQNPSPPMINQSILPHAIQQPPIDAPLRTNSACQPVEPSTGRKSRFVILNSNQTVSSLVQNTDNPLRPDQFPGGQQQSAEVQVQVPQVYSQQVVGTVSSQSVQQATHQQSVLNFEQQDVTSQSLHQGVQFQEQQHQRPPPHPSSHFSSSVTVVDDPELLQMTPSVTGPMQGLSGMNQSPTRILEQGTTSLSTLEIDSRLIIHEQKSAEDVYKGRLSRVKSEGIHDVGNSTSSHLSQANDSISRSEGGMYGGQLQSLHSRGQSLSTNALQPSSQKQLFPPTHGPNGNGSQSIVCSDVSPILNKPNVVKDSNNGQQSCQGDEEQTHQYSQLRSAHLSVPLLGQQYSVQQSPHLHTPIPAPSVVEVVGTVPVVRIKSGDGTVIKKKGRFNFIESPSISSSLGSSGENQTEASGISTSNAAIPSTGQASTGQAGQALVKKGRFVVMNTVEPSIAAQNNNSTQSNQSVTSQQQYQPTDLPLTQTTVNRTFGAESLQAGNTAPILNNENEQIVRDGLVADSDVNFIPPSTLISNAHQYHTYGIQDSASGAHGNYTIPTEEDVAQPLELQDPLQGGHQDERTNKVRSQSQEANRPTQSVSEPISPKASPVRVRPAPASQYGGIGKTMHHLNQIMSELNEIDRVNKLLQTENKCLKEKNKELEAKARDWERKFVSERTLREKYESKVKELKATRRAFKEESKPIELEKEEESLCGTILTSALSRTSSVDGEILAKDVARHHQKGLIESQAQSGPSMDAATRATKVQKESDIGRVESPSATREIRNSNQTSPQAEHSTRNLVSAKPPILPVFQKRTNPSSNGVSHLTNPSHGGSLLSGEQRTTHSQSNSLEVIDAYHDSPPAKVKVGTNGVFGDALGSSKFENQADSEPVGPPISFLGIPPRPASVNGTSYFSSDGVPRVPGSSLTKNFDPYAIMGTSESSDSDNQATIGDTSIPQYNHSSTSQLETNNSMNQTNATSLINSNGYQVPMFVIEQNLMMTPSHPSTAGSNDTLLHPPMMTYSQPFPSYHPSVNGSDHGSSSKDHSRNPSVCPAPNQSWSNSPIYQGSSYPDLLSSSDDTHIGFPSNEYPSSNNNNNNNSDVRLLETTLLKHVKQPLSHSLDESLIATTDDDPFDALAKRKIPNEDFTL